MIMTLIINFWRSVTVKRDDGMMMGIKSRKKLWEFPHNFQCSIIGTCLTLGEARKIGRKFGVTSDDPTQLDATIHSFIVRESSKKGLVSTHVCNLLNRKFEGMIRRSASATNPPKVLAFWREAYASGFIPSGYWAALTNPALDEDGSIRIFSDVHMLSHINGSNNVALIRRLAHTEKTLEENLERQSENQRRSERREQSLRQEIDREAAKNQAPKRRLDEKVANEGGAIASTTKSLQAQLEKIQLQNRTISQALCERNKELSAAKDILKIRDQTITKLRTLIDTYEKQRQSASDEERVAKPPIIDGMQFLYVGGRPQTKLRIQTLVQKHGADLVCHDGRKTKSSICALRNLIETSHAVFMPVDRVSHASALETKRLCRQCKKPFITMKSCSMSCFQQALLRLEDHTTRAGGASKHPTQEADQA